MNQYFTNNEQLKSERRIIKYQYGSLLLEFISDNGVFAKNHLDYGSRLLVDTFLKSKRKITNFLDVGCGYGTISVLLSKILHVPGVGCDVNKRALKLAEENAKINHIHVNFIESDCYQNIEGTYDLIITNPPIRAGKKVVLTILKEAIHYLNPDGELWFVIRKDQGAKSVINEIQSLYKIDIREKSKGFYIIMAKKS